MAFPSCDILTLNGAVPGSLQGMSDLETQALLVLYLYHQLNPSQVNAVFPASTELAKAACLDCGVSDGQQDAYRVWLQRQAAIDAGAAEPAFNAATARANITCLACLPLHRLRALEILYRCQLS